MLDNSHLCTLYWLGNLPWKQTKPEILSGDRPGRRSQPSISTAHPLPNKEVRDHQCEWESKGSLESSVAMSRIPSLPIDMSEKHIPLLDEAYRILESRKADQAMTMCTTAQRLIACFFKIKIV